jgi:hypothetical protein
VFHPGGGEFANVARTWGKWTFKKDAQAAEMFMGDDCSLCVDPNWAVEAKGFGE